ncbi:MAG: hypothetical protein OXI22_04670 [Defluviicoccus sp.]|nr:hypothetical protein [Defluviicoccus sp.]MDE0383158.1 hypothetical protein [Defluviicoccus sp.]
MSDNETRQFGKVTLHGGIAPDVIDFSQGGNAAERFVVQFDDETAALMIGACKNALRRLGGRAAKLDLPTAKYAVFALLGLHVARQVSTGR